MIRALTIRLLAASAALLTGCASSPDAGSVTLPRLPAWIAPHDTSLVAGSEVAAQTRQRVPGASVYFADAAYTRVSRAWLDQYLAWEWAAAKTAGIHYTAESWDCDDFGDAFRLFATMAAARAGVKAAPLVAVVVVQYDATQRHIVAGVVTDEGEVIVEPNPGFGAFRVTPFAEYHNRIHAVAWGVPNPF